MKINYTLSYLTFALFGLLSCNIDQNGQQINQKKGNATSSTKKPVIKKPDLSMPDAVKIADAQFKRYLPKMLEANNAYLDSKDIFTGDFTGDGIADVAIYFSLAPNEGGNTIVAQGLTLYQNNGNTVKVIAGYEPNYLFNFVKIKNGKIYVEKLEYTDTDGRCCPSLKTAHTLRISGNRAY